MISIEINRLAKAYKTYPNIRARFWEWISPFKSIKHSIHWVLKDIDLQINRGEAVGIIGMNGAGKSTLLKIIAGTLQATHGLMKINGKVVALLELGIGFHPDFTGRQNVLMSGQLLGLSTNQILNLMPEIENFSEIGELIDKPVRIYSSGMQIRLAFSIATAVRPDILIVDEALSVGDTYFQHKSFNRIRKFRNEGTSLLLVTHDNSAIQAICDKAVLLHEGAIMMQGKPDLVLDYYNALLTKKNDAKIRQTQGSDGRIKTTSGNGLATITHVELIDKSGHQREFIEVGEFVKLKIRAVTNTFIPQLVLGFLIKDRLGQSVFGTNTFHLNKVTKNIEANTTLTYTFEFYANLGVGTYSITTALHEQETHLDNNFDWQDQVLIFNVNNTRHIQFDGLTWLDPKVNLTT